MSPPPARLGNICVWLVSAFLFLSILIGGGLLILYITLPETETTVMFPAIGMVLVGLPWVFWIMTCFYRSMTIRGQTATDRSPAKVVPDPAAQVTGDEINGGHASPLGSPGGAKASQQEANAGGAAASIQVRESGDGSSLGSHESEIPLALSMS